MPTYRPNDAADRDACIAAEKMIRRQRTLPRVLSAALEDFADVRDEYVQGRAEDKKLERRAAVAAKKLRAADREFAAAFRRWTGTVRDAEGKSQPAALAPLLDGVNPGALLALSPREELTRTDGLLDQLAEDPTLAGDLDRLTEWAVARDALAAATEASEHADRSSSAAKEALAAIAPAFDRTWGVVVREARKAKGEIAKAVPTFAVRRKKPAKSDTEEPASGEGSSSPSPSSAAGAPPPASP